MLSGYLQRQAIAHIAGKPHIQSGLGEDVVGEHSGGGFAVATGDAHHFGIGVAPGKLNFADDRNVFSRCFLQNGNRGRDARTLDNFVGLQHLFFGVLSFFPSNVVAIEQLFIFRCNAPHIAQPHIHTLHLGEHGGSGATFASTKHYYTFVVCCHCLYICKYMCKRNYRIFNVTKVITAKKIATKKNRITIFDSGMALRGFCQRASTLPPGT